MATRLKNRNHAPVGGFMYFQPQTGMHFTGWSFAEIVKKVVGHRLGNPRFNLATDEESVAEEIDEVNALRMLSIPGAEIYVTKPTEELSPKTSASHLNLAARNVVGGAKALLSWSISGEIVEPEVAVCRAKTCATCPNNKPGDLLSFFTEIGAAAIRKELEVRNKRKLTTPSDKELSVCDACWCPLKLKVWCPEEIILKYMTPEAMAALHPDCWIPG